MALYARQGVAVHAHILTDGAGDAAAAQRAPLAAARRAESQQAVSALLATAPAGQITCDFGPYHDRTLLQNPGLVSHITGLLQQHAPQVVLAPSPWEIHPDHQACARAALAAVLQWQRTAGAAGRFDVLLYEVGSPLRANFLLDITPVWADKAQAMQCFASQLQQQDYARHIQGLNTWRTYTLPPQVQYAEAYHHLSGADLQAMAANTASAALHPAVQCTDRWLESVLHSASVHVQAQHQALLEQSRQHQALLAQQHQLQAELDATRHSLAVLQQSRVVRLAGALRRVLRLDKL